jgi:hypothetical protein
MPIKVKGLSYAPVLLTEVKDTVYFGQTKVFSDFQRAVCPSLQAAIDAGRLAVLDETPLEVQTSFVPAEPIPAPREAVADVDHMPVAECAPQPEVNVEDMARRVADLVLASMPAQAAQVAPVPAPVADKAALEAIDRLANKIDGLVVSGVGVTTTTVLEGREGRAKSVDEVFVPSIRVDDMSNHVTLEARSIGQGTSVNAAVAALRNIKKPQ